MHEFQFRSSFKLSHILLLFCISILLKVSPTVEALCISNPISLSNITSCTDNMCSSVQLATASTTLQPMAGFCITYEDPRNSSNKQSYECSIDNADVTFITVDDYFTDDFLLSGNVAMDCSLLGLVTHNCPCDAPDTIDVIHQFCLEKTVGSDCLVGRSASTCAKATYTGTSRYLVGRYKDPTYHISLSCVSTSTNITSVGFYSDNKIFMTNQEFNVSSIIIEPKFNKPGDFRITDTTTGYHYNVGSNVVNAKGENNPYKFGAIQFSGSTYVVPQSVRAATAYYVASVADKRIIWTNPIPSLEEVIPQRSRRDPLETLPYLSTGFIWFSQYGQLCWVGRDLDGRLSLGPMTFRASSVFISVLTPTFNIVSDPDSIVNPYFNSSCFIDFLDPSLTSQLQTLGIVTCPGVRYLTALVFTNNGSLAINYYNSTIAINGRTFPQPGLLLALPFASTSVNTPIFSADTIHTRSVDPEYEISPITGGTLLTTMYVKDFPVSFQDTTVRPKISSLKVIDQTISVEAFSDKIATCTLSATPAVIPSQSVSLKTYKTVFEYSTPDISYTGNLTVFIFCGRFSDNSTVYVSFQIPKDMSFIDNISPTNWDVPWYYNAAKITLITVVSLGSIYFLTILYRYFRKPNKLVPKRTTPPRSAFVKFF